MGGKSGGYDTSGLERATREANRLQEQIYNESIQRGQPFYDVGVSGLGALADYLGLSGGSVRSRDQIRQDLLPQYTTTSQTGAAGQMIAPDGSVVSVTPALQNYVSGLERGDRSDLMQSQIGLGRRALGQDEEAQRAFLADLGYTPSTTTQTSVDENALRAAIDAELMAQEQTPDYYGSLLQPFGQDQFQADPGFQFRQQQGQQAIDRMLAASGQTNTPRAAQALAEFNQGLAAQAYQDAYNRYNQDQANIFNRLASIAGLGQQQTGQMAGLGQNYASSVGQNLGNLATAQSQAAQAQAANRGSMFNTLLGLGTSLALSPATGGGTLFGSLF